MTPEDLVRNTWYVVYLKETKKVIGEIVFTSYNKGKDSIMVSHAIPLALRKMCVESMLQECSKYEYRRVEDLKYPKGHVNATSPFYYINKKLIT
jgi:hypothetical protein